MPKAPRKLSTVAIALAKFREPLKDAFRTLETRAHRRQFAGNLIRQGLELLALARGMDPLGMKFGLSFDPNGRGVCAFLETPARIKEIENSPIMDYSDQLLALERDPRLPLYAAISQVSDAFKMPIEEVVHNVVHNLHVWRNPPPETLN